MTRMFAFLTSVAAWAMPAQAGIPTNIISGTFSGTISSGTYTIFPFSSPIESYDLTGGQIGIFLNVDEQFGPYEGDVSFSAPGGQANGAGNSAFTNVSAANGILTIDASFSGLSNNGAGLVLKADVVNGMLTNWRGSLVASGQFDTFTSWKADALFTGLTFNGTYSGVVPEPAAWGMMIAGFGLTGSAVRRNSRAQRLEA